MLGPEDADTLIARIAKGERDAFQTLYDDTSDQLFGVCTRILQNATEAEDVLQSVYVSIWEDADAFRRSGVTPDLLLVLRARMMAIALKRARRSEPTEIRTRDLYVAHDGRPARNDPRTPHHTDLKDALLSMPPARAVLLERVVLDGESYDDLAVASDVDTPTIRMSMRKTLGKVSHAFDSSIQPDDMDAIAAAEKSLGLSDNEHYASRSTMEEGWMREIGTFVLQSVAPITPPTQVLRRIEARVFNESRDSLWDQIWPYAIGGIIAALVLWMAVSSDLLLALE
jgi:RNA polymerase sigma-70 factor (ECF subfamily)